MTDHYIAYCESQVRELRGERDRFAAENESLRATVDQWHKRIEHTQCGRSGEPQCECCYDAEPLRAEVQALRATVERVRDACFPDDANREDPDDDECRPFYAPLPNGGRLLVVPVVAVLDALGGVVKTLNDHTSALARIREAIEPHMQAHGWQCPCCAAVHNAIEGES